MSNNASEPQGHFVVPKSATRPPIVVDCSEWVDTSDGTWTFENFVVPKSATRPPIVVDCSGWGEEPAPWLELVASSEVRELPSGAVMKHTLKLVNAISKTVPELGLSYEMREEGESQVVSLRTKAVGLDAAELARLAEVVRKEVEAAGWKVRMAG